MATTVSFKRQRTLIGSVLVDATVQQTHEGTATVTQHPIEVGSKIADHIRPENETLTLDCLIGSASLDPLAQSIAAADELGNLPDNRGESAYRTLLGYKDNGTLITVLTSIRSYENMAVTKLTVPRDAKTGDGLQFSIGFMNVRFATSQRVRLPAIRKAKPKATDGNKPTRDATPKERESSSLAGLTDLGTGSPKAVDKLEAAQHQVFK